MDCGNVFGPAALDHLRTTTPCQPAPMINVYSSEYAAPSFEQSCKLEIEDIREMRTAK